MIEQNHVIITGIPGYPRNSDKYNSMSNQRYRSMDLLRAAAILLVILAHTILSYGAPAYLAPWQLGGTGVDLFFVLSGWLLGCQLFKEAATSGRIDIKKFWIRRWMRTLPAYYVVLIPSIFQRYLTKDNIDFPWEYFVFIQNYDYPLHFFSISWSLCVEEQFYLLIAPLLAFLTLLNKKNTTALLILLLIAPYCFRELGWYSHPNETHVRIDSCVAGVFLAHIHYQYRDLWNKLSAYAVPLMIISIMLYASYFVARYNPHMGIHDPNNLVLALIFGIWVMAANADNSWRRFLYIPGAYHIATRSYALYLLHPEVLALMKRLLIDVPFVVYLIMSLAGSLILSEILYRLVEKPIMDVREKHRFSSSSNYGKAT